MQRLVLAPGVNRQQSQTAWEGGVWNASLVRWRQGMMEKFGGWVRYGSQDVVGVPRSMLAWAFLTGDAAVGIGTNARLMLSKGGTLYDITPVQQSVAIVDQISTTIGLVEVSVALTGADDPTVGDYLVFPGGLVVGGIPLDVGTDGYGCYPIKSVAAGPVVTFDAQVAASSTVSGGGGSVTVEVLYPVGPVGFVGGLGYGAGTYSRGVYGGPATTVAGSAGMRHWSMGAWGERLLSVPSGGPLFRFAPSPGGVIDSRAERVVSALDGTLREVVVTAGGSGYVSAPTVSFSGGGGTGAAATATIPAGGVAAIEITNAGSGYTSAPTVSFSGGGGGSGAAATAIVQPNRSPSLVNGYVVVAAEERRAIVLGSGDLAADTGWDPMQIRHCSRDDDSDWYPEPDGTNSAGVLRAQEGSRLVAGMNLTLATLVWSDTALLQMRFVGAPYWYSIELLGRNCGLIGPSAFGELGGSVFWMSRGSFWMWRGGAPQQIDCSLFEDVFGALNPDQVSRVCCGTNVAAQEVLWFYAGDTSEEVDRAVIFNVAEGVWYPAALARSVWMDAGLLGKPIAASASGRLYQHETGVDADGAAMGEFFETGYVDVADGEELTFLSRLLPDWQRLSGSVQFYVKTTDYPGKAPRVRGPFSVNAATQFVGVRARGRQMALRVEGTETGGDWRMGALRAEARPVGRR